MGRSFPPQRLGAEPRGEEPLRGGARVVLAALAAHAPLADESFFQSGDAAVEDNNRPHAVIQQLRDAPQRVFQKGPGRAVCAPTADLLVVVEHDDTGHVRRTALARRHEPGHRPRIGEGPVIKTNSNQAYATDAESAGFFSSLCARVGVTPQNFVTRSDLGCGSTIGPITAAKVGIPTLDVGNPMLSMHSVREMCGSGDQVLMTRAMARFLSE